MPPGTPSGDIRVFEVQASGAHVFHFDLYDSVQAGNKARAIFAPFSHDADTHGSPALPRDLPAPGTLLLVFAGLAAAALRRR